MKLRLHGIVNKWEQSGNGEGQRDEDNPNWGTFNLQVAETIDGDAKDSWLIASGTSDMVEGCNNVVSCAVVVVVVVVVVCCFFNVVCVW